MADAVTSGHEPKSTPANVGLQPPQSPRKSVNFTYSVDFRPQTADNRTITSMDGPPLEPIPSERKKATNFLAPTSTKDLDIDDYFVCATVITFP